MEFIGAAIDIETTGLVSGLHEMVELTIILHDEDFKPKEFFTSKIKPIRPEIADPEALIVNNLSLNELMKCATPAQVRNALFEWLENMIGQKKIFPLGHNYNAFDKQFIKLFLGHFYDELFYYKARDTFVLAQAMKDASILDVKSTGLIKLCESLVIPHKAHSSYGDAMASLLLYKKLITILKEVAHDPRKI